MGLSQDAEKAAEEYEDANEECGASLGEAFRAGAEWANANLIQSYDKYVQLLKEQVLGLLEENAKLKAENWVRKDASLRTYDGLTEKADRYDELRAMCEKMAEALEIAIDDMCHHHTVAKEWLDEHADVSRYWCGNCHSWVYRHELNNEIKVREALAEYRGMK